MKTTVLLPDDSYCKTDLGLLLYKSRKVYGFFAQIVNVRHAISMLGHVEYDINIRATPHNSLNYDIRNFAFTSRFRDLNRLHGQMAQIHRQLHLKDTFPAFADPKFFGSSSQETIEERRRAIETFLNFVLKSEVLCKSRAFQTFIEITKEERGTGTTPEPNQIINKTDEARSSSKSSKSSTSGSSDSNERKSSKSNGTSSSGRTAKSDGIV